MYLSTADAENRWWPIGDIMTKGSSDIDKLHVN